MKKEEEKQRSYPPNQSTLATNPRESAAFSPVSIQCPLYMHHIREPTRFKEFPRLVSDSCVLACRIVCEV